MSGDEGWGENLLLHERYPIRTEADPHLRAVLVGMLRGAERQ